MLRQQSWCNGGGAQEFRNLAFNLAGKIESGELTVADEMISQIPLEKIEEFIPIFQAEMTAWLVSDRRKYLLDAATKSCRKVVDLLLRCEPDLLHAKSASGTALQEAIQGKCKKWGPEYTVAIRILLHVKSDVNVRDQYGRTPLSVADRHADEEITDMLLQAKADVTVRDAFEGTPLHDAAKYGTKEIVRMLLVARADANAQDRFGWTPLHEALAWSKQPEEVVRLLLQAKADVGIRNRSSSIKGYNPLEAAIQENRTAIVRAFLGSIPPLSVLEDAWKMTTDGTPEIRALLQDAIARRGVANGLAAAGLRCDRGTLMGRVAGNSLFEPRVFQIVRQFLGPPSYSSS